MNEQDMNSRLEQIKDRLTGIETTTGKRQYLLCEAEDSFDVSRFLFKDMGLRFVIATAIDSDDCFEVLHHFSNDETGHIVTVKAFIRDREKPSIESIAQFLPAAEWIEREMHDEFGIEFRNHPNMRRLILADDWPEGVYPLRKERKDETGD